MSVQRVSRDALYELFREEMAAHLPADAVARCLRKIKITRLDDAARPNWTAAMGESGTTAHAAFNAALIALRAKYDLD